MTAPLLNDIVRMLASVKDSRVFVAGDVILDEYLEGGVDRISPEAPVPVLEGERIFHRAGGAANVALGLAHLGAKVRLCTVVGDDAPGDTLLGLCTEAGIDTRSVARAKDRRTSHKVRLLARRQQLLRIDWEKNTEIDAALGERLFADLYSEGPPDAIILSDYAKGFFLSRPTLRTFIEKSRERGVPVLIDPKARDYSIYRGATLVKPNLKELEVIVQRRLVHLDVSEIAAIVKPLAARFELDYLVVTLGERGMLIVQRSGEHQHIPARTREVYDVTGAGDTAIIFLALGQATRSDMALAGKLANVAAGMVVSKLGTATVTMQEMSLALPRLLDLPEPITIEQKVLSQSAMLELVRWWRLQGKRIVFTNGCFDLIHVGHVRMLAEAARHGDILVVAINSDASVQRLKGPERPIVSESDRATVIAAMGAVDAVCVFDEETPRALIEAVQPDVIVKGGDYETKDVVGREVVEARGGKVVIVPTQAGHSTTALAAKLKGSEPPR